MKQFLALGGLIGLILMAVFAVIANYQYSNQVKSYWDLAEKSSSIEKKSEYLDKFVYAIEHSNMYGHNALIFKTPDNSYQENLVALKSLQNRMHDISKMDVSSFEYNTAIQQITTQEQGEAEAMIGTFRGIWYKSNYILLWDWISITTGMILTIITIFGFIWWADEY